MITREDIISLIDRYKLWELIFLTTKKNVKIETESDTPNPIRIKISLLNFEKNL